MRSSDGNGDGADASNSTKRFGHAIEKIEVAGTKQKRRCGSCCVAFQTVAYQSVTFQTVGFQTVGFQTVGLNRSERHCLAKDASEADGESSFPGGSAFDRLAEPPQRGSGALRHHALPVRAKGGARRGPPRSQCSRDHADRRGQEPHLPTAGVAARKARRRCESTDCADAGPAGEGGRGGDCRREDRLYPDRSPGARGR